MLRLTRSKMCISRWIQHSCWNSNRNISLTASSYKDYIIVINSNYLNISQPSKVSVWLRSQEHLFGNLSIIVKASLSEFIFSKVRCFQYILLKIFRNMHLKLKSILWETCYSRNSNKFQVGAWNCKSFAAKTFDNNTLKLKAGSPTKVIKNRNQCF